MSGFLTIVALVIGYMVIRFMMDMSKDNHDLEGQTVADKFAVIVGRINEEAFGGAASVTPLDKRSFNLYRTGDNQIVNFNYSTGHLTIEWRYKYLQKEVFHRKQFMTPVTSASLIKDVLQTK